MRVLWSSEVKQYKESLEKLKRYSELVAKISTKKPFNAVVKDRARLTDEEHEELSELRMYFGGLRVNEAGIALLQNILGGS